MSFGVSLWIFMNRVFEIRVSKNLTLVTRYHMSIVISSTKVSFVHDIQKTCIGTVYHPVVCSSCPVDR
jgi:hypothetical protein